MNAYPDGCTQAMHDAAHQSYTPDESNAIREELDWRAEQEVQDCAQCFVDWLMDRDDITDLSRMIAFYKSGRMCDCRTIVDNIVSDYQQYRAATLTTEEQNEIARTL